MAYKTASLETAKVMVRNFKETNEELQKLEKDKTKKNDAKKLAKDVEAKGKKIEAQLGKILDETRKEFNKHAANIDKLVAECKRVVKTMEGGVKTFQKKPDNQMFLKLRQCPKLIEDRIKIAEDDNKDFGGSWFELRGIKWISEGLDEKYNSKFYKERFELMGDAKSVVTKIDEIRNLHKEATLLSNEAAMHYAQGAQDEQVYEEDAQELLERVKSAHKDFDDKTYDGGKQERTRKALQDDPSQASNLASNIRSRFQDNAAIAKEITGKQGVFNKEIAQLKKAGQNPTANATKTIEEAERLVGEFAGFIKLARDAAAAWAEMFKEAETIAKKKPKPPAKTKAPAKTKK